MLTQTRLGKEQNPILAVSSLFVVFASLSCGVVVTGTGRDVAGAVVPSP